MKKPIFQSCLIVLAAMAAAAPARAAGIVDPDAREPVSRFGQFTADSGGRIPASETVREMDAEDADSPAADRSLLRAPASDRIAMNSSAQAPTAAIEGQPLGTLRRNGVQEVAVIAGDLGFFPRTVFVTRDIPVRMYVTGASKNPLCIMMDSFNVRKQVRNQSIEELSFTPGQPGRFRFYCPVNGAEGYIVVREFGRGEDS